MTYVLFVYLLTGLHVYWSFRRVQTRQDVMVALVFAGPVVTLYVFYIDVRCWLFARRLRRQIAGRVDEIIHELGGEVTNE